MQVSLHEKGGTHLYSLRSVLIGELGGGSAGYNCSMGAAHVIGFSIAVLTARLSPSPMSVCYGEPQMRNPKRIDQRIVCHKGTPAQKGDCVINRRGLGYRPSKWPSVVSVAKDRLDVKLGAVSKRDEPRSFSALEGFI